MVGTQRGMDTVCRSRELEAASSEGFVLQALFLSSRLTSLAISLLAVDWNCRGREETGRGGDSNCCILHSPSNFITVALLFGIG